MARMAEVEREPQGAKPLSRHQAGMGSEWSSPQHLREDMGTTTLALPIIRRAPLAITGRRGFLLLEGLAATRRRIYLGLVGNGLNTARGSDNLESNETARTLKGLTCWTTVQYRIMYNL